MNQGQFALCGCCQIHIIVGPFSQLVVGKVCDQESDSYGVYEVDFLRPLSSCPPVSPTSKEIGQACMTLLEYVSQGFDESLTIPHLLEFIKDLNFKHPLKKKVKSWLKSEASVEEVRAWCEDTTGGDG